MAINRRSLMLAAVAAPAGCTIQPLSPVASVSIPPPAKPTGPLRAPVVGHSWTYRKLNFFNSSVLDVVQETVTSIAPTIVVQRQGVSGTVNDEERYAAWGQLLRECTWDYPMTFESPVPLWPVPLTVGASASSDTRYRADGGSIRYWIQVSAIVRGWERITVQAATFDALRVERLIRLEHQDHTRLRTVRRDSMWLSPEVGRWVARETSGRYDVPGDDRLLRSPSLEDHIRWELMAWR